MGLPERWKFYALLVSSRFCREASMKALGRALRVDLRRSVLSGAFLLTVVLMLAWMCFNSAHYLFNPIRWGQISAAKMLFNATCTSLGLAPLLFAIATVPYAWSFLQDRRAALKIRQWSGWVFGPMALPRSYRWPCRPFWRRRVAMALRRGALLSGPAGDAERSGGGRRLSGLCSLRASSGVLSGADRSYRPQL